MVRKYTLQTTPSLSIVFYFHWWFSCVVKENNDSMHWYGELFIYDYANQPKCTLLQRHSQLATPVYTSVYISVKLNSLSNVYIYKMSIPMCIPIKKFYTYKIIFVGIYTDLVIIYIYIYAHFMHSGYNLYFHRSVYPSISFAIGAVNLMFGVNKDIQIVYWNNIFPTLD